MPSAVAAYALCVGTPTVWRYGLFVASVSVAPNVRAQVRRSCRQ